MKNYIFGYGSLIQKESRLRTTPNALKVYPVKVHQFTRGWWARTGAKGFTTTFLGCFPSNIAHKYGIYSDEVNGVIYEVSKNDLIETDKREQGYKRKLIPINDIEDYTSILSADSQVWVYTNEMSKDKFAESQPNKNYPIVQSYVDICISGCLEIEAEYPALSNFTIDFIKSTQCWSTFWANDRLYPRRPFIYTPAATVIDSMLSEYLEDKSIFNHIYIE